MSQPTRTDEIQLYAAMRAAQSATSFYIDAAPHCGELRIDFNRGKYLLDKWSRKGWWVSRNDTSGEFTAAAPMALPAAEDVHDRGKTSSIVRPTVQVDEAATSKREAERMVARWVREINDPESVSLDDQGLDDLVDLVALQAHNHESLIVFNTNGSSNPLDPAWLDDMLSNGPRGQGLSVSWLIQAVYAQARILASRSGITVREAIGQAAEQLDTAARARPTWTRKHEAQFASMRRVVTNFCERPRDDIRQTLAEHPRQALAVAVHTGIATQVSEAIVAAAEAARPHPPTSSARRWFARLRHALTHPASQEGLAS
ncbi:hypothetical protein ASG87_01485 [Frateuria sp. Soil773]|uniref:hypothetical protein n=1 Tax=Frateuria sp. Soil773 TaxID=1736407 RepID=UPI0006F1F51D|nr:hypothetical protein [Frateuria sp. Soil773]KRE90836.1 hypothetical protein ASG87_01485 [Frateuria sp. Soil773]